MNDQSIRVALLHRLSETYQDDPNTLIVEELGVLHGSARIDIAVVNGTLAGFEIKSDRDSLRRLPTQARQFSTVLHAATLVVGAKHHDKAIEMVPIWWGIELATQTDNGKVSLERTRSLEHNPNPDPRSVAKLLWRNEALDVLEELGLASGFRRSPRREIYSALAAALTWEQLHSTVCACLKKRENWRPGVQPK